MRQIVPFDVRASAGQAALAPSQTSAGSHPPADARHSNFAGRTASTGQSALTPSHASGRSHAPATERQTVFAESVLHTPARHTAQPCPQSVSTEQPPASGGAPSAAESGAASAPESGAASAPASAPESEPESVLGEIADTRCPMLGSGRAEQPTIAATSPTAHAFSHDGLIIPTSLPSLSSGVNGFLSAD
jgi:hypothetical protein